MAEADRSPDLVTRTYTCPECKFVFKKRAHLLRHQLIHTDERPYVCEICHKGYRTTYHLNRHLSTHNNTKSFKCDVDGCSVACKTEWNLKRHIKRTHCGKFKCPKCDMEFKKNKNLQQHLSCEHKNNVLFCEFPGCGQIFSVPSKMRHHMKIHTERGYLCPVADCHQKFTLWSQCRMHAAQCKKKEISCDVCGKVFTNRSNLKAHRKIHSEEREVFLCSYEGCGRFYTKAYNLRAHVQSFHMNIRPYLCPKKGCNKSFHFPHLLRNHLENIHDSKKCQPRPERRKRRPTTRVQATAISGVTGYIPELWKRLDEKEVQSYVDEDKRLSSNGDSSDETTQHEMPPVLVDTDASDLLGDRPGEEKEGCNDEILSKGGSSPGYETITELVEIHPYVYKPVQRRVKRPLINQHRGIPTVTSPSQIVPETSNVKSGDNDCMVSFNKRFQHMLGKSTAGAVSPTSCHIQSINESDSSDSADGRGGRRNEQVECLA